MTPRRNAVIVTNKTIETAVSSSISADLNKRLEATSRRLKVSRSEVIRRALYCFCRDDNA